jgi:hypothetical protein
MNHTHFFRRRFGLVAAAIFVAAGIGVAALCARPAMAQGSRRPVYVPPNGFWNMPNLKRSQLYGPTRPDANWAIAAWSIPEDLPAFDRSGVAQNQWARVAWLGGGRYELSQNGAELPCLRTFPSGRSLVNEFDLFASPINKNEPNFPQAVADNHEALAGLSAIDAGIQLTIEQAEQVDQACSKSQSTFMFAVVLSNKTMKQFLFYQLRLAQFSGGGGGLRSGEARPAWYFTGNNLQSGASGQWGYGDNITSFGQPWARTGVQQRYDVDLLPRLRDLIQDGARYGLDQDLGHWQVTGTYHGQNVTGHIRNKALWSDFSLSTTASR